MHTLIGKFFPIFIGWLVWRKTGNIFFGVIAATVLEGFMGPLLDELGLLFVKKQDVQALDPFPAEQGKGVRVLVARKKGCALTPEDIAAEMREKLSGDEEFTHLYQTVVAEGLPIQRCLWDFDALNNGTQTKAIREWVGMGDISLVSQNAEDGHFYEARAEGGEYAAVFCFSQDIPTDPLSGEAQALSEEAPDVQDKN